MLSSSLIKITSSIVFILYDYGVLLFFCDK